MPDSTHSRDDALVAIPHSPVVIIKDGVPVADSRNIAADFGKRHKDVLEKIDNLLAEAPELLGPNFRPMFIETQVGNGGFRRDRAFEMDEVGFALVGMRFTGARPLRWQIAYAKEYKRMREALLAGSGSAVVDSFGPKACSTIGGIVKRVTHAEVEGVLSQVLPALVGPVVERLVNERMMSDRLHVIEGVSALEIAEMAGYVKGNRPRGMTQFITWRIRRYHEDRGYLPPRSRHGSAKVRVYNEALSRQWLVRGGRSEIDQYAAERRGQGALRLVQS